MSPDISQLLIWVAGFIVSTCLMLLAYVWKTSQIRTEKELDVLKKRIYQIESKAPRGEETCASHQDVTNFMKKVDDGFQGVHDRLDRFLRSGLKEEGVKHD